MAKIAHYKLLLCADENGSIRLEEVVSRLGVSAVTAKKYARELERENLIEARDPGVYSLTIKGLQLVEFVKKLSTKKDVPPYLFTEPSRGEPIQLKVSSYEQLYGAIEYGLVPSEVINEHIKRGFLSQWVRDGVGDRYLYELITSGRVADSSALKAYLKNILDLVKGRGQQELYK